MKPILEIKSLNKSYKGNKVISDLSLSIMKGEFVSILGKSGCGKSTLLRLIASMETKDEGYIEINNSAYDYKVFMIFQNFNQLFPWKTVIQNVSFPLEKNKKSKFRKNDIVSLARNYLSLVEYDDDLNKYPFQLSGGMKQKVALARALCLNPALFLMDEPFASLDAQTRTSMQNLLVDLSEKKEMTVLFVTHDILEALNISDRIVVLGDTIIDIPLNIPKEHRLKNNEILDLYDKIYQSIG